MDGGRRRGGALGLVVGGLLVDTTGWRGVFWLLASVAAAVLVVMWWLVPVQPSPPTTGRGLDLPGSLSATAGLVLLVLGAGLVGSADPLAPPVLVIGAGLALLGVFVVLQRRGRAPLIAWTELTNAPFMTANGTAFVNTATTSACGTLVALVAQRILGLDARATGLALLPFSLMVIVGSTTGAWWLRRRAELGVAAGLAVAAAAMLALAAATAAASVAGLAAAAALAGLGLSWAALTSTHAATTALPEHRREVAAGAVNTAAQIGTALGVAVLLALATLVDADGARGQGAGYVAAFLAAAALAAAYAVLLTLRHSRS